MDPLSLAASIAGLAGLISTIVTTTYQYGSGVIGASESRRSLLSELQHLRTTLQQLEGLVTQSNASSDIYPHISARLSSAVSECTSCMDELYEKLLRKQDTGKVKNVLRSIIWPLAEKDTLKTIATLDRLRGLFQLGLSIDTWNLSSLTLSEVKTLKKRQDSTYQDNRVREILEWLSSLNYQTKHVQVVQRRVSDTGKWLIETSEFRTFIQAGTASKLLWCYGIPGAGKTVLSSIVIDHIQSLQEQKRKAVIYYYFDYQNAGDQNPDLICAAFLKQLALQTDTLSTELEELYNQLHTSSQRPKTAQLVPIIISLLRSFNSTYIIIDALDECFDDYRHDIFSLITRIQTVPIHIFVTSRPHPEDINTAFAHWPRLEIRAHEEDIRRLFNDKLEHKPSAQRIMTNGLKEEIFLAIIKKAQGMFLWAALQIEEILKPRTKTMMRKNLEKMPSDIYGVFDQTLLRIKKDEDGSALAQRTFLWIAFAKEPLKYPALSHALSIVLGDELDDTIDIDNIPTPEDLLDVCCGLLVIDADQNLRFVHFTVQEYFVSHPESLHPLTELHIAKVCLSYLSLKDFESGYCDSERKVHRRLEQYPLLFYAARKWADHVPLNEQLQIQEVLLGIYLNKGKFTTYSQIHYYSTFTYLRSDQYFEFHEGYTPLHNATELGLADIVALLVEYGEDSSTRTVDGVTPLHIAVDINRKDIVQQLLRAGANISLKAKYEIWYNSRDETFPIKTKNLLQKSPVRHLLTRRSLNCNPVILAAVLGYTNIFKVFLDEGVEFGGVEDTFQTAVCLPYSQEKIAQEILDRYPTINSQHPAFIKVLTNSLWQRSGVIFRLLWNARPDINDQDGLLTSIFSIVITKRPEYINILLDKGVDVNGSGKNNSCGSPLFAAIDEGNEELAKILINKGADISARESGYKKLWNMTPLQIAAAKGLESIVKILLDLGCDVESANSSMKKSPLTIATEYNTRKVVELLLSRGANVEGILSSETTPLGGAAFSGSVEVGKTLIHMGANVNANGNCGTPMIQATSHGHEEFVTLLISHGAEINSISEGPRKETALYQATSRGHENLCDLLLRQGADPNCMTANGTPLLAAAEKSYNEIANMLLDYGANPMAQAPNGLCALELAVAEGNDYLVQLLLNRGVDINSPCGRYISILHAAVCSPDPDNMTKLVLEKGAKVVEGNAIFGGILHSAKLAQYALLIKHGADINALGGQYNNALQAIIANTWEREREKLEGVKFLVNAGANVNAKGGVYGSALQAASRQGNETIVAFLLDHGAEPNFEGGHYRTALQAAAYKGNESIVALLLVAGAQVNRQCGRYNTALQAAAFRGHEGVVRLLITHGANLNASGGVFRNPLRASRIKVDARHKIVEKILLDSGAVDDLVSR